MVAQGSNTTSMVPLADLGAVNTDQYTNYCADLWEQVEAGNISEDEAATLLLGPEPEYTFTRWTA